MRKRSFKDKIQAITRQLVLTDEDTPDYRFYVCADIKSKAEHCEEFFVPTIEHWGTALGVSFDELFRSIKKDEKEIRKIDVILAVLGGILDDNLFRISNGYQDALPAVDDFSDNDRPDPVINPIGAEVYNQFIQALYLVGIAALDKEGTRLTQKIFEDVVCSIDRELEERSVRQAEFIKLTNLEHIRMQVRLGPLYDLLLKGRDTTSRPAKYNLTESDIREKRPDYLSTALFEELFVMTKPYRDGTEEIFSKDNFEKAKAASTDPEGFSEEYKARRSRDNERGVLKGKPSIRSSAVYYLMLSAIRPIIYSMVEKELSFTAQDYGEIARTRAEIVEMADLELISLGLAKKYLKELAKVHGYNLKKREPGDS